MLDRGAIEQIYRGHGHVVLRRARQLLGDVAEADEVLQELFTSLVERPAQYGARSGISTWLYSATTHLCLNRLRNRRNRERVLDERAGEVVPDPDRVEPARAEALSMARQLLSQLPEELAQVAVYYHFDEMTQDEIAAVLACSRRHVGHLLERLKARIDKLEHVERERAARRSP